MSSQESSSKEPGLEIFYTRLSPSRDPSNEDPLPAPIIFLHGAESCNLEFSRVTPFLSKDYDLILVDLPQHSGSKKIPFSLDNAINALSHLISTKVVGRRAHIVGMSLGGFVGLEFARRCPELVISLFCTGCAPFSGFRRWLVSRPRLLSGLVITVGGLATESIFWWSLSLEPLPGLRDEFLKNRTMSMLTAGYRACIEVSLESLATTQGVRIAVVAGGKLDSIKDTREAGKVLESKNPECKAFVVRDAIHLWDLQLPELFAQGVRAWVEGSDMPEQFELLN